LSVSILEAFSIFADMIIYFLYDTLLLFALPVIIGYHLFRSLTRRRPAALPERFGFLPSSERAKVEGHETIWIHAVSVGETIAAKSLLKELKKRFPQKKIVLSNVTETGRSIAVKLPEADLCIYFPFDYGFAARKLLDAVNPSLVIIVETEIWPNFLRAARMREIPVVLVNGRISDRSFDRYKKLRWVFRRVLADFSAFCMQTAEDAKRIAAMGAQPENIHVTNNLKYDIPVAGLPEERSRELRDAYHIPSSILVFTAGSTHQGEEELVIKTYKELAGGSSNVFLILAPRHPERAVKVSDLLRNEGIGHKLRSGLDNHSPQFRPGEVLLLDTVGELASLYAISDLVFVGGSLVPIGGHNILEPASMKVPVIFGPFMNNFREITAMILKINGAVQISDGLELTTSVRVLLEDEDKRHEIGANGARLLDENRGSTERHMEIIASFLENPSQFRPVNESS
jgi:3-deoxy-D-manno-octulosonic-acid transferase